MSLTPQHTGRLLFTNKTFTCIAHFDTGVTDAVDYSTPQLLVHSQVDLEGTEPRGEAPSVAACYDGVVDTPV